MRKFKTILFIIASWLTLSANAQLMESVYLKDSVTVYRGVILEQSPAKYPRIYRMPEKDTITVALTDIWKIVRDVPNNNTGNTVKPVK